MKKKKLHKENLKKTSASIYACFSIYHVRHFICSGYVLRWLEAAKDRTKTKKCPAIESTRHSYINGLVNDIWIDSKWVFSLLNKTLKGTIFETSALVLTSKVVSSKTVQENFELTVVIDASREVSQQETVWKSVDNDPEDHILKMWENDFNTNSKLSIDK